MVEEATDKLSNGFLLKRVENPFFENVIGLRSSGLTFKMSNDEQE